jgi:hypothetical protein
MTRGRRRPHQALVLGIAASALLLAACGEPPPPTIVTPTPGPSPSASASPVAPQSLKPMLQGLVDRNGPPPAGFQGAVTSFVVNVSWATLQPTPDGPITSDNPIDQAIAAAERLGPNVGVKIRLLAGIDDPDWVKQLDGGPVAVNSAADAAGGTIGRFWTADFGTAYDDLWSKLAARYDAVPQVREITVARCMTVFDETFLRDTADTTSVDHLLAAGFTTAADQTCLEDEIAIGAIWKHTRIGVAFNPYQEVLPGGEQRTDEAFTESMMQLCRANLGAQCVLENNSIRWPPMGSAYTPMYAAMQSLGAPISFQTATTARIGSLDDTLAWAITVGADAVELPQGYAGATAATLRTFASRLALNPS